MKHFDISPFDPSINVLRPLINVSKTEIVAESEKLSLPYITDPTNKDNSVSLRNELRNTVLPWFNSDAK